jgi:GT2 family glycosyltransferase
MNDYEALKQAYTEECCKCAELAERVADLTMLNDDLAFELERIKSNPFWKLSSPFRKLYHFYLRQLTRLRNAGNLSNLIARIQQKRAEKKTMKYFGTLSFPSAAEAKRQSEERFERMVKFSILSPLYNTPPRYLREMITSVIKQTYPHWELCMADGSDEKHSEVGRICQEYCAKDERIKYRKLAENEGITGNTNQCLALASGEYIGLLDHDDIIHPAVLYEYVKIINEEGADYLYCDEATFKKSNINKMVTMHFKPDFAIDNLRANNYICHFSVFWRELIEGNELLRREYEGSQDHDMVFRLTAKAKKIVHHPKLLYYWRSHRASTALAVSAKPYVIIAAKKAVADHLRRCGFENFRIMRTKVHETIFKIAYQIEGTPKISIIIANKDHASELRRLLTSIFEKSTYTCYEIIIVENNSREAETFAYYEEIKQDERVKVCEYPQKGQAFNYSALNNYGVAQASGEYILLLNNDMEVIRLNWLEELLMYAQRQDVGAVGGKLYHSDGPIQHAGLIIGLGDHGTAIHAHYRRHHDNIGYMGRLFYVQNVSAVTGACLMVKKSLFEELGGLDEVNFAVGLNDVDFCLRLREKGYLNIFTPFAELVHYESLSRGSDKDGANAARYDEEAARFRAKWQAVLAAGDPYYNPNLAIEGVDYTLRLIEERK